MGTWSLTGSVINNRDIPAVVTLHDGSVLSIGGFSNLGHVLATTELYTPAAGTWMAKGTLPVAKCAIVAVVLQNGMVLEVGGTADNNTPFNQCSLYDPSTGLWTATGSMNVARWGHAIWTLPNGNILVAGGFGTSSLSSGLVASAEIYDVGDGTWSLTGSMAVARAGAGYASAASGKCVILGGDTNGSAVVSSIEVYNPLSGTWSTKSSTLPAGFGLEFDGSNCAIQLQSGVIFYVGGRTTFQGQGPASAMSGTYEESTDTLVVEGNLTTGRVNFGFVSSRKWQSSYSSRRTRTRCKSLFDKQ